MGDAGASDDTATDVAPAVCDAIDEKQEEKEKLRHQQNPLQVPAATSLLQERKKEEKEEEEVRKEGVDQHARVLTRAENQIASEKEKTEGENKMIKENPSEHQNEKAEKALMEETSSKDEK